MVNSEIADPALEHLADFPSRMRLWDYLKRNCGSGNKITLVQTEVAKTLGVSRVTVCNNLKALEGVRFIVKNGKHGTANAYMLNPNFIWNGNVAAHGAGCVEFFRLVTYK